MNLLTFLLQKHKSRKEVMEEIILKSKFFKVVTLLWYLNCFLNKTPFSECYFYCYFHFFLICLQAQKAKDKEENEELMEQLDKNFTALVQSEALLSLTQPSKMNALKALVNRNVPNEYVKKDELSATQSVEPINQV